MIGKLLDGYGSFFGLNKTASKVLILVAALLQPSSGFCGLLGGVSVVCSRRFLKFHSETEKIETVNGILFGMLIGSLYKCNFIAAALIFVGGLLAVVFSNILSDTLGKWLRLPLLGLPYSLVSFAMLPAAACFGHLAPAAPAVIYTISGFSAHTFSWLFPLGAMYFNGTTIGGLLVLTAFALSSRYLAVLAVLSAILCGVYLHALFVIASPTLFIVAQMNGVLTACVIGGLYATPGKRSCLITTGAALLACTVSVSLSTLLALLRLPILALPFDLTTYGCMLAFNANRGKDWTYFWLAIPALPELSLEQIALAKVRGVDSRSVALNAPFDGQWQVYQGFDGVHTHSGIWQYALDFFQTHDGLSYSGVGESPSDYYAFGRPLYSPVHGTVIEVCGNIPDNQIGSVDTNNNWGNYILIQLDSGRCVMLAHLQRNSIRVSPLERVTPGKLLAAAGNSGRSPQPHLHLHVQESRVIGSKTVPFHLSSVILSAAERTDLEYSLRSCPAEGDIVHRPTRNLALKRALKLNVGNRFKYEFSVDNRNTGEVSLEVRLDTYGQFWLESETGARIAFTCSDDFLAFYNRQGPPDLLLDTLVMCTSLTPLIEGPLHWNDLLPNRLLPANQFTKIYQAVSAPLSACSESSFARTWDPVHQLWIQSGDHSFGNRTWRTVAKLCENSGLICFTLTEPGKEILWARLISHGVKRDNGIPAQEVELVAHV